MKYKILLLLIFISLQSCITQEISQNDVFNPVKEVQLNSTFTFKRNFIKNTDSTRLETWYLTESNPEFYLIYLSGNSSNIRSAIPFFNELGNQLNVNIYTFNYSGYGLSEGKPSIDGIVRDGNAALDYFYNEIKNQELPTILLGYSLGGYVALNLMDHESVDKGIIMSTFSSLEELQEYLIKNALPGIVRPFLKLEVDKSVYKLDNLSIIKNNKKPILFIHGEADKFIPPSMSKSLYNLSPSEIKDIKIIKDADHRMVLKDTISNKLVVNEIKKFLTL